MDAGTQNTLKEVNIGHDVKLMVDEDNDLLIWHPSSEHETWSYLDIEGIHKPSAGSVDDLDNLTIDAKIVCPSIMCGVQGYIRKGKWENENPISN